VIALLLAWVLSSPPVPSFDAVRASHRPSEAVLLDRHGEVLHELRVDPSRRRLAWVGLGDVSPALPSSVVAVEDRRFWSHGGVDGRAVLGALWSFASRGPRRGASTVTMQTASMLSLAPSGRRGVLAKLRQMRAAWALEAAWSKAEILEAYLNLVSFRGEVQGVGAAAGALFGKAPHGLTAAESAVLAALVAAPNASRARVARRLRIDAGDALDRALETPSARVPRLALAPHVAHRLLAPRDVGTPVGTTLDARVQRTATEALRRGLLALRDRRVSDGAVLVVENATGDVLAYVGSGGDVSSARWVDGVRAPRQAGSTLKPLLYASAFERRLLTAAALLDDSPLEVPLAGAVYRPENYDQQFRGLVSARTALASSLNVPAVRALGLVGGDRFVDALRSLGFAGVVESGEWYGPGLALGGVDVTLWELVAAYRSLAVGGEWSSIRLRPSDVVASRRVFSPEVAWIVGDVLADRESRSTTFGLESVLGTGFWSAVKTGTSKEMRDNWCVGWSSRFTVGVWVGNFSGRPMENVSGVTGAAPVWVEVMTALGGGDAPPAPAGVRSASVAFPGGVEAARSEWFVAGSEPAGTALASSSVRIVAPVEGTIVALDPEVPVGAQRVGFLASSSSGGDALRWTLDGRVVGAARDVFMWNPTGGRHVLTLVDAAGRTRDAVRFVVRGGARSGVDRLGASRY
jgi:penicillin-binding protein 1C